MPIQLNQAVVHELVKESGVPNASMDLADQLLYAENQVVVDLVDRIVGLIGQRENAAHFGVFRNDPARTRIPDMVTSYCMQPEPAADDFLQLTNDCMIALRDTAQSRNLATGGYLLFADYTSTARFLLVAMIKQRSGITMEELVPTSITELDFSKLHQVARVSFERLCSYERSKAEQQDMTYVTFVSPKGCNSDIESSGGALIGRYLSGLELWFQSKLQSPSFAVPLRMSTSRIARQIINQSSQRREKTSAPLRRKSTE